MACLPVVRLTSHILKKYALNNALIIGWIALHDVYLRIQNWHLQDGHLLWV